MAQSLTLQETLERLSSKPGVQATLVLSRKDGAVIQSSGFPSIEPSSEIATPEAGQQSTGQGTSRSSNFNDSDSAGNSARDSDKQQKSAEETARAVFNYVADSGKFIEATNGADDVQLLRLRTKKQEVVIVPDQNYLMVVFQDTSKS